MIKAEHVFYKKLMTGKDVFAAQIKQVWKEAPIEGGMLDYLKFVQIIKRGKDDE